MADSKISALSDGSPIQSADAFAIARSGSSLKLPATSLIPQTYVGYNTIGGTTETVGTNTWKFLYKTFTLTNPGFLASIDVYCKGNGSNVASLFSGLMDDNAGAPGKTISIGTFPGEDATATHPLINTVFSSTPRWVSMPSGIYLPAATYWFVICYGNSTSGAQTVYFDGSGSDRTRADNNTWLNEATTTSGSNKYSIRGNIIGFG